MRKFQRIELGVLVLAWAAGLAAFAQIMRLVIAATIFPMELEVREGYSWLFVLAMKAGVSIYDHSQVAMISQHYGPIEPVVKYFLSMAMPFLPSQVITRFFVPLLPPALVWMSWMAFRNWERFRWPLALLSGSVVFMAFVNIIPFNGLAGRTDIIASFLVALQAGAVIHIAMKPAKQLRWFHLLWPALLPTLIFLSNTRCAPVCGTLWLVQLANIFIRHRTLGWKFLGITVLWFVGFLLGFVLIQFRGDFHLFFKHFIGIQIYSGLVAAVDKSQVKLFPDELLFQWFRCVPIFVVFLLAGLAAFLTPKPLLGRGLSVAAWALAGVAYVVIDLAWQFNIHGGGVHYFDPLLIQLWWLLLIMISTLKWKFRNIAASAFLVAYLAIVPSWKQVEFHLDEFATYHEDAQKFRDMLSDLYDRDELMGEALQLYKNKLGGSLMESPDATGDILPRGYMGEQFGRTAQRYFDSIKNYRYFLHDGIVSTASGRMLEQTPYFIVAEGPPYRTWNGPGGCKWRVNCNRLLMKKDP